jgi:hypothetical protein
MLVNAIITAVVTIFVVVFVQPAVEKMRTKITANTVHKAIEKKYSFDSVHQEISQLCTENGRRSNQEAAFLGGVIKAMKIFEIAFPIYMVAVIIDYHVYPFFLQPRGIPHVTAVLLPLLAMFAFLIFAGLSTKLCDHLEQARTKKILQKIDSL